MIDDFLGRALFLPTRASTFADRVDGLHYVVLLTTMAVSTAVGLTALAFFVRYRRRSETQQTPDVHPPLWLEGLFIGVPLLFFLAWFATGFRDFVWLSTPPKDAIDIYVMGKQWMWKYSYPDGPSSVEALRVPVGRPVRLLLTSRDVIHSFFVPAFRIKQDALPGRYTQTWFTATRPGRYAVLCAEYCGLDHSMMRGEVIALEPAEYDQWLEAQRRAPIARLDSPPSPSEPLPAVGAMAKEGASLAQSLGCLRCHSTDGSPHIGPTFKDLYRREQTLASGEKVIADEAYLTASMMEPLSQLVKGYPPVMPSYLGRLAGPDTAALLEYLKSLRGDRLSQVPAQGPAYEPRPAP